MLNAYSRRKDGNALLSRSFRVREFACRDGSDPLFVDSALVQLLQSIRDHFGAPVVITSGYRTAAHNKAVGGAPLQPALLRQSRRHPGGRCSGGAACRLRGNSAARHRRHWPLPGKGGPGSGLGACGRAPRQKPVDGLRG